MPVRIVWPLEYDVEDLKRHIDMRTLVTPGLPTKEGKPTKTNCFWHQDRKTPSLYVYPDHLYCYSCEVHMDALDYVAWQQNLDVRADFEQIIVLLSGEGIRMEEPISLSAPRKELEPLSDDVALYMHRRLGEKREWFYQRGLSDWIIDQELLGYDRRAFVVPVWSAERELLTLRYRRDDLFGEGSSKYWGMKDRNEVFLYNAQALGYVADWQFVVICEGELDALLLYQHGLPAVSATNGTGAFNEKLVNEVLVADPSKVIVAYDQDRAGWINGVRVARLFGLRGRLAQWPESWGNDPTEVLKQVSIAKFVLTLQKAVAPQRYESGIVDVSPIWY